MTTSIDSRLKTKRSSKLITPHSTASIAIMRVTQVATEKATCPNKIWFMEFQFSKGNCSISKCIRHNSQPTWTHQDDASFITRFRKISRSRHQVLEHQHLIINYTRTTMWISNQWGSKINRLESSPQDKLRQLITITWPRATLFRK